MQGLSIIDNKEDEILYEDASKCLEILSSQYKIGIIANLVKQL